MALRLSASGSLREFGSLRLRRSPFPPNPVQRQRGDVGVEEAVERSTGTVVVERGELLLGQAEQLWLVPRGPLADAVEGLARDEQVPGEQEQGGGGGDAGPSVLAREVVAEELLDAEPLEEAIEDRQCGDPSRVEGTSPGVGGFARPSSVVVLVHVSSPLTLFRSAETEPIAGARGPRIGTARAA